VRPKAEEVKREVKMRLSFKGSWNSHTDKVSSLRFVFTNTLEVIFK